MEENISFELSLYGDKNDFSINDMEFCADRIAMLPKIRPHQLEKAVSLSIGFCKITGFRESLLEKSNICPVLIYQMNKRGIFLFEEIEPSLRYEDSLLLCYYFRQNINDFEVFIKSKNKFDEFDEFSFKDDHDFEQMLEYGFPCSSFEYCLKYDVVDDLIKFDLPNQNVKWSPFEWSIKPKYLDPFSFSGFFGSIKCFKYLLMNGFQINDKVLSMVVCSGCLDLFHLCNRLQFIISEMICRASEFCQLSLLVFMIENYSNNKEYAKFFWDLNKNPEYSVKLNGYLRVVDYHKVAVNVKTKGVMFQYLILLLFILLLKMVIFVLSNI